MRTPPGAPLAVLLALGITIPVSLAAQQRPRGTLIVTNKAASTASLMALSSGQVVAELPTGNGPHEWWRRPTAGPPWPPTTARSWAAAA